MMRFSLRRRAGFRVAPLPAWGVSLLAFALPFCILSIAFALNSYFPLGSRTPLTVDLYHQYAPFLMELRDKLLRGDGLFYSMHGGLGFHFYVVFAYYLSSPFNLLLPLFPAAALTDFVALTTLLRVGLASLCFSFLLRKVWLSGKVFSFRAGDSEDEPLRLSKAAGDWVVLLFSAAYALSGFVLSYDWNIMWLDVIALFPVVILGLLRLVRNGRAGLYLVSLAACIILNYYMALFACIFCVLYFFVALITFLPKRRKFRFCLARGLCFGGASLLAGLMSAFLTLPTYLALAHSSAAGDLFPREFHFRFSVLEGLGRLFPAATPVIREGLPNVYAGLIVVLLLPLYFINRSIPLREKAAHGTLLVFLFLSFNNNALDFLWNGLHYPNQLPYRYAWLAVLLLLIMSCRSLFACQSLPRWAWAISFSGAALYLLLAELLLKEAFPHVRVYAILFLLILYGFAFRRLLRSERRPISAGREGAEPRASNVWIPQFLMRKTIPQERQAETAGPLGSKRPPETCAAPSDFFSRRRHSRRAARLLALLVLTELLANAVAMVAMVNHDEYYTRREDFNGDFAEMGAILRNLPTHGDEAPARVEMIQQKTSNSPALYTYPGLSGFSSTFPEEMARLMKHLGYSSNGINSYIYSGSTAVLDALFAVRYVLDKEGGSLNMGWEELPHIAAEEADSADAKARVYRNPEALPLGFLIRESALEDMAFRSSPFDVQNDWLKHAVGVADVFQDLHLDLVSSRNYKRDGESRSPYVFRIQDTGQAGELTLGLAVQKRGRHYLYVEGDGDMELRIQPQRTGMKQAFDTGAPSAFPSVKTKVAKAGLVACGDLEAGTLLNIELTSKAEKNPKIKIYAAALDETAWGSAQAQLRRSCFAVQPSSKLSDGRMEGSIEAQTDGILFFSIPYDEGWSIEVDGARTPALKVQTAFLGVRVDKGQHKLSLRFRPRGLTRGLMISAGALGLSLLWLIAARWTRRRRKCGK